jgi:hypothetical protein
MRLFDRFFTRGGRHAALAAAIIGVVLAGEVSAETSAETSGSWYLVIPPLIPERQALIKAYTAESETDVEEAVEGLAEERQVVLASKAYSILIIPTVVERTEALLDALQDTSAPTSSWRQVGMFESAASCERERELALQTFEGDAMRVRASDPESEELSTEGWKTFQGLSACRKSRCVPGSALSAR